MTVAARIYWLVGIASVALLAGAFLFPADRPDRDDLPWHIEHPTPESVRILGLTLGKSTPADAERRFRETGEFAIFRAPDGRLAAEVFFEQINLAGLRSRVVLTLDASEPQLQAMHDRGLRIAATISGKKVSPAPADVARLRATPVSGLTLIPGIRVADALLEKRFGAPALTIREPGSATTHRLYPQHALDIATSDNKAEKQVLQFVAPKDYAMLVEPLQRSGGQVISRQ